MGRVLRSDAKCQGNKTITGSVKEKLEDTSQGRRRRRRKPPEVTLDKSLNCGKRLNETHNLKDVQKRTIFGDKTNKFGFSSDKKQKKLSFVVEKNETCNYNPDNKIRSFCSPKKQKSNGNMEEESEPGNLSSVCNSLTKNVSDRCVYSRVTRGSSRIKNMAVVEKLAEYDFEIDENEPMVKKRKKNVKHRKRIKSPYKEYKPNIKIKTSSQVLLDSENVGRRLLRVHDKQIEASTICGNSKSVSKLSIRQQQTPFSSTNLISTIENHNEVIPEISPQKSPFRSGNIPENNDIPQCNTSWSEMKQCIIPVRNEDNILVERGRKSHITFSSPLVFQNVLTENKSCTEDITPIKKTNVFNTSQKRKLGNLVEVFEKAGINTCENLSVNNALVNENTPCKQASQEFNCRAGDSLPGDASALGFELMQEDQKSSSSHIRQSDIDFIQEATSNSQVSKTDHQQRMNLNESAPSSSSICSSNEPNKMVKYNFQSSSNVSLNHSTSQQVFILPRMSGIGRSNNEEQSTSDWNIDNCFGFEDDCREMETDPLPYSLKKRLRRVAPSCSTPLVKQGRKLDRLSTFFKTQSVSSPKVRLPKLSSVPEKVNDSPKTRLFPTCNIAITSSSNQSKLDFTPDQQKVVTNVSSFPVSSNPMKQTKLDFKLEHQKAPTNLTPQTKNKEPVLLFNDPVDETPVRFSGPARRSYERSFRRKMKPLGDGWTEVATDSEDENEYAHKSKNVKKTKKQKNINQEVKEANKWIKSFNEECEEIEEFELCVE